MSLPVEPYVRDSGGIAVQREGGSQSHKLVGFESWRREVWGSDAALALGLSLLPTLRSSDLYAEGDDLARLESELAILLEHVESVASQTRKGAELIRENAQNILTAISRARELGGGVVISS